MSDTDDTEDDEGKESDEIVDLFLGGLPGLSQ